MLPGYHCWNKGRPGHQDGTLPKPGERGTQCVTQRGTNWGPQHPLPSLKSVKKSRKKTNGSLVSEPPPLPPPPGTPVLPPMYIQGPPGAQPGEYLYPPPLLVFLGSGSDHPDHSPGLCPNSTSSESPSPRTPLLCDPQAGWCCPISDGKSVVEGAGPWWALREGFGSEIPVKPHSLLRHAPPPTGGGEGSPPPPTTQVHKGARELRTLQRSPRVERCRAGLYVASGQDEEDPPHSRRDHWGHPYKPHSSCLSSLLTQGVCTPACQGSGAPDPCSPSPLTPKGLAHPKAISSRQPIQTRPRALGQNIKLAGTVLTNSATTRVLLSPHTQDGRNGCGV
ncbi:lITAF domain-containing protein isoform X2 [Mirounga angustirostris]|uniref:lITAF domain-containing protein isoform X2 n=1 Tax=Mirounga angustirostris TaxID=9716 RepID=UPI001E68D5A9|nr:lITAF domain-containing protein isoform X2 [Mirounga angustirostris]